MKLMYKLFFLVILCGVVNAQTNEGYPEAMPPPDLPDPIQSGQPIEPEVTIIQSEDKLIEEYRVNGSLYMVKVTPSIGPPYYLLDQDGDGKLESRTTRLGSDSSVPQWILFQW